MQTTRIVGTGPHTLAFTEDCSQTLVAILGADFKGIGDNLIVMKTFELFGVQGGPSEGLAALKDKDCIIRMVLRAVRFVTA